MAAPALGRFEFGRLVFTFWMHNRGSESLQFQSLRVVVVSPDRDYEEKFPLAVALGAGSSAPWSPAKSTDDIWFPFVPSPKEVRFEFRAAGFSDPKVFRFPIRAHRSPTPEGAYRFPGLVNELGRGEYWAGEGDTHSVGGFGGVQAFAYDLGVCDWMGGWLKTSADGKRNEDFLSWGKGVHAMADGEVMHVLNELPSNPAPLTGELGFDKELAAQKDAVWGKWLAEQGLDPALDEVHAYAGNHLYLRHGDEIIQYAHFQEGSIPDRLLTVGARVEVGEFLGLLGNSGNSTAPHLHVHATQGSEPDRGSLRPILFSPISVLDRDLLSTSPAPWVPVVDGRALPPGKHCIWPTVPPPLQRLPEESLFDPLALMLRADLYVKLKLPRPPELGVLLGVLEPLVVRISVAERREALARLRLGIDALTAAAEAIESAGLLAAEEKSSSPEDADA